MSMVQCVKQVGHQVPRRRVKLNTREANDWIYATSFDCIFKSIDNMIAVKKGKRTMGIFNRVFIFAVLGLNGMVL